jgi:hypothetical protein
MRLFLSQDETIIILSDDIIILVFSPPVAYPKIGGWVGLAISRYCASIDDIFEIMESISAKTKEMRQGGTKGFICPIAILHNASSRRV